MRGSIRSGYSEIQIRLHWLIAGLVAFQLAFGDGTTKARDAAEEGATPSAIAASVGVANYWFGIAVLVLVAIRITVRLRQGVPQPVSERPIWMGWAAKLVHMAFHAMLMAMPVLGLLTVYVSDAFGDIHKLGKPIFLALILIHVLAALFNQFVPKDGTLRRIFLPAKAPTA